MASLSTLFVLASVLCLLRARGDPVGAGHARDRDAGPGHDAANPETVAVAAMGRSYTPDLAQPPRSERAMPATRAAEIARTASPIYRPWRSRAMARSYNIGGRGLPGWLAPFGWLLAGGLFGLFGVFTKENAALLPLYLLLPDRVCFRRPRTGAGCAAGRPTDARRWLVAALPRARPAGLVCGARICGRPFTLTERVLTKAGCCGFTLACSRCRASMPLACITTTLRFRPACSRPGPRCRPCWGWPR